MAGTIPTVVSYGIALLRPAIFYAAVALICAVVGRSPAARGPPPAPSAWPSSAWRPILGMSTTIAAGAVISGAYMGDKMSPLSETTDPGAQPGRRGDRQRAHPRDDRGRSSPSFGLGVRRLPGRRHRPTTPSSPSAPTRRATSWPRCSTSRRSTCCPSLLLIVVTPTGRCRRSWPSSASPCSPASWPASPSPTPCEAFVDEPGQGAVLDGIEAIYAGDGQRLRLDSGNATIDDLFSRGGMSSMLTTVWLILGALSFAADHGGSRLPRPADRPDGAPGAHRRRADRLGRRHQHRPQRRRRRPVRRRRPAEPGVPGRVRPPGARPRMLSRTVEDTGTVTSPLVPWNSCGAYMTGVLGVPTMQYLPWAFFNILNPLVALAYAFTGFRIEHVDRSAATDRGTGRPTRCSPRKETVMSSDVETDDGRRGGGHPAEAAHRRKRRFTLPSAYTILFALIVLTAIATWIIPAGQYALDAEGSPDPGHLPGGRVDPVADHRRLAGGADQRALRHRGPGDRQRRRVQQRGRCSAPSTSPCSSSSSAASSASR